MKNSYINSNEWKDVTGNKRRRGRTHNGIEIKPGKIAHFIYGIPFVVVNAPIIERDGKLIMLTPDHNPQEMDMEEAMRVLPDMEIRDAE